MTTPPELSPERADARRRLMPMLFGMMHAQVLHTMARLRIPDLLADGPAVTRYEPPVGYSVPRAVPAAPGT